MNVMTLSFHLILRRFLMQFRWNLFSFLAWRWRFHFRDMITMPHICDNVPMTHLSNVGLIFIYLFIYNIRRIARLFPTVHYALNLIDAARDEIERNMERRHDFRCRRKPKCSEKTCAGKYGSRTKFTYDSDPTGNRTRAALVKGTGTTAAPTRPPNKSRRLHHKSHGIIYGTWLCAACAKSKYYDFCAQI